jgi:hypothetical protein
MFAVNPLLYLKSAGKLPMPFKRKAAAKADQPLGASLSPSQLAARSAPALLDSKGRPVPPDVRAIVDRLKQPQREDA